MGNEDEITLEVNHLLRKYYGMLVASLTKVRICKFAGSKTINALKKIATKTIKQIGETTYIFSKIIAKLLIRVLPDTLKEAEKNWSLNSFES